MAGEYFFPKESFMDCSDKCKNVENMNPSKDWSFLWIGDPVLEEEKDVFEADSHSWSQEVWVLLLHLSGFSSSLRCDQEHGAATALTEIFFFLPGKWGIVILLWVLHIPWEVLKSSVHTWRVAAPSRDAPPGRAVRPVSVKVSLCLARCVKHNSSLSTPDSWPGTSFCPLPVIWPLCQW